MFRRILTPNSAEYSIGRRRTGLLRSGRLSLVLAAVLGLAFVLADTSDAYAQRRGRGRTSISRSSGSRGARSISRPSSARSRSSGIRSSSRGRSSISQRSAIRRNTPSHSSFRAPSRRSSFGIGNRSISRSPSARSINRPRNSLGSLGFNRSTTRRSSRGGFSTRSPGITGSGSRTINRSGSTYRSGIGAMHPSRVRSNNGNRTTRTLNRSTRSGFNSTNRSGFRQDGRSGFRSTNRGFISRSSRSAAGDRRSTTSYRRSSAGFGNTRFGNNRYGNHSLNYANNGPYGNHSINYAPPRGRGGRSSNRAFVGGSSRHHRSYGRTYGRGFRLARPYRNRGFGYGGYRSTRFRIGPIYYGHHHYRPYYRYYGRSHFSLGIGFGFYGGCYSTPIDYYYPTYYPAYIGPTYISQPIVYDDPDDAVVIVDNDDPDVLILNANDNTAPTATTVAPPVNVPQYDDNNPLAIKINEGAEKFEQGDYNGAAQSFEEVALADRNNADAWFALGTAKFATGDYPRSASAIRQGIQAFPEMVNTVFDIRDRYGNIDDFQKHIETLERHVESNQNDIDAHIVLGFVYHFTGQRQWAKEVFQYVSEKSPNDTHLARVFMNAKEIPESAGNTPDPNAVATAPQTQPRTILAQPPVQPTVQPAPARTFQGTVADEVEMGPKRILTTDGIVVEYDDVDDEPLRADFKVTIGGTRLDFKSVRPGQRVGVRGQSGREYWITPIGLNKDRETITFSVTPK